MKKILFVVFLFTGMYASAQSNDWKEEMRKIKGEPEQFEWLIKTIKDGQNYREHETDMLKAATRMADEMGIDSAKAKASLCYGDYYRKQGNAEAAWAAYQTAKIYGLRGRGFNTAYRATYTQGILLLNMDLPDSLLHFLDKNRSLISLAPDPKAKLYWEFLYPMAYHSKKEYPKALAEYRRILPLTIEGKDTSLTISIYINIGSIYDGADSSMIWYRKALDLSKMLPRKDKYASSLMMIGRVYTVRDDALKDSALFYFLEAEKYMDDISDPRRRLDIENFIGDFFVAKKEYALALPYFRKAYQYATMKGGNMVTNNLAMCFLRLGKLDSARYYLDVTKKGLEGIEDNYETMLYLITSAEYEAARGDSCSINVLNYYDQALDHAIKGEETYRVLNIIEKAIPCLLTHQERHAEIQRLATSMLKGCAFYYGLMKKNDQLSDFGIFLGNYADLEAAFGDREKAIKLYQEKSNILERMNKAQYTKGLDEAVVKYKSDLKDAEIAYSKRVNLFLIAGAVILFLAGTIIYISQRRTRRLNKIITEQKREVEQINVVKDRLFSLIGHDMRGPLNSLVSFTQLLENSNLPQEKFVAYASELKGSLAYTSSMMDNMLNWARSQLQGFKPAMERFDLSELTNEVVNALSKEAEQKQIRIENHVQKGQIVLADINMTKVIIRNLLNNAIKYTAKDKTITLSTRDHDGQIQWIIEDEGVGMPKDVVDSFNDPHDIAPLKSTMGTGKEKGTGLGLLLCKSFARLMQASISVHSETGKGCTFTLTLKSS